MLEVRQRSAMFRCIDVMGFRVYIRFEAFGAIGFF